MVVNFLFQNYIMRQSDFYHTYPNGLEIQLVTCQCKINLISHQSQAETYGAILTKAKMEIDNVFPDSQNTAQDEVRTITRYLTMRHSALLIVTKGCTLRLFHENCLII